MRKAMMHRVPCFASLLGMVKMEHAGPSACLQSAFEGSMENELDSWGERLGRCYQCNENQPCHDNRREHRAEPFFYPCINYFALDFYIWCIWNALQFLLCDSPYWIWSKKIVCLRNSSPCFVTCQKTKISMQREVKMFMQLVGIIQSILPLLFDYLKRFLQFTAVEIRCCLLFKG